MQMVLIRGGERLELDWRTWAWSLALGRLWGWVPAGAEYNERWARGQLRREGLTEPEVDAEVEARLDFWDGSYTADAHQVVRARDAAALADALDAALPDLPDHEAAAHLTVVGADLDGRALAAERPGIPVSPLEGLSGRRKGRVRELVAWCRCGGFEIAEVDGAA